MALTKLNLQAVLISNHFKFSILLVVEEAYKNSQYSLPHFIIGQIGLLCPSWILEKQIDALHHRPAANM